MFVESLRLTGSGVTNSSDGRFVTRADRTTMPISTVFGRFKDMPVSSAEADFTADTSIVAYSPLDKFEGMDFRRWQKKMHFLLSSMSVVCVLTTPIPEDGGDDATVEQIRKKAKWDNDDYVYRGLILNGMSNSLFDIYQNVESSKELWDSLEAKYMAKVHQVRSSLRFTQHKMNMDEAIQFSCIIDKLPPSWKEFKHTLKHLKEELTLVELGSHLCIEESLRMQDNDKPKGSNVDGPLVVNMVEHNNSSRYNNNKGKRKHHDNTKADPNKKSKVTCWKCGKPRHLKKDCKGGKFGNKVMRSSLDFYMKFYNSLGRAPNRCSSSIGKTLGVVIVNSRNRLGRL
ncbi:zinc finger, CCHC-type containing protein [Tanacetum coccineum]